MGAGGVDAIENKVGPMRLYVGSLHFNITEDMLRGIFEPFGKVSRCIKFDEARPSFIWEQKYV